MINKIFGLTLLIFVTASCKKEEVPSGTLAAYLEEQKDEKTVISNGVIACAMGGQQSFMVDTVNPVSVFFYPEGEATEFKFFETDEAGIEVTDYTLFKELDITPEDVFNGYLIRFPYNPSKDKWCIVSYMVGDELRISNPVKIKYNQKPTEFNNSLLTVTDSGVNPTFTWDNGIYFDNDIYFQVISDTSENLITGTYTKDQFYTHYDTSNVVLNITDEDAVTSLNSNTPYVFTMMGVSEDNWVNLVIQTQFITQ